MAILVTGGLGYIGSHTAVELLSEGRDIVVIDDLSNSSALAADRIREITGKSFPFIEARLQDEETLNKLFSDYDIEAVIHFAGSKAVGESVKNPIKYYDNNIGSSLSLCRAMLKAGCKNIIFSSSATVYGSNNPSPYREDMPAGGCTNPYGETKLIIEQLLGDIVKSNPGFNATLLRYFNPIGAHPSGLIGEDPRGIPNNLLPYIAKVAVGQLPCLGVFGNDYQTPDGTGVRDYIHVVDLAKGHTAALNNMDGLKIYNLGTGKGYSVLEVLKAFEKACGKALPYEIKPRREGDLDAYWSDPGKAERELGWRAQKTLYDMCLDTWRWQKANPKGYEG
ncbi:MAG: UDP-glucose 4-epimerase GalE [Oscillospiraceae bacterium]|nr:UDP-glucose 4-epimerase GalE [Oscillospiraceae bacterium]